MSGHTAACRARYSSSLSGLTLSVNPMRCKAMSSWAGDRPGRRRPPPRRPRSFVDVVFGVHRERPHHDAEPGVAGGVLLDRVLAHAPGGELLALDRVELAGGDAVGGVVGEVAEVDEAPQRELRCAAALGVLAHLVGEPEAGHPDLIAQALVGHGLARGGNAHGGGGHDQLEVGVRVDEAEGLVVGLVRVVVAVDGVDQLEVGVLVVLEGGVERLDPGVLVGRVGRRRQDRQLAALVAEDLEGHIGHHHPGLVEVDLGHEQALALARRDGRVPAHHGHVGVGGGVHARLDLLAGVVGDHDRVDALGGGVGHGLDLARRVFAGGRAQELGLRGAELLGGLLGTLVGLVEHGDAGALGQQDRVHVVAALDGDGFAGAAAGIRARRIGAGVVVVTAGGCEQQQARQGGDQLVLSHIPPPSRRGPPPTQVLCHAAASWASAPLRRSGRRSSAFWASTDAMSSTPITPVCVLDSTLARPSPLRRFRTMPMANATPSSVPEPPKMLTPPSSTMVMMSSSKPSPMLARTEPRRAANSTPATPATKADAVNSSTLVRATSMPEKRATSALSPRTNSRRPTTERCRTIPPSTSSTRNRTSPNGIGPMKSARPTSPNQSGKSPIDRSSSSTRAAPRNPISPASVTTSDEIPVLAITQPCSSPAAAAATSASTIASQKGTPDS